MVTSLLYIIFVFSALVLIVVILLQEGKGGGFGQALGEHGQQTFGVGSKGSNQFTGYTAVVFLATALLLHLVGKDAASESAVDFGESAIEEIMPTPVGAQPPAGAQAPAGAGAPDGG